jgi:signal transduction histidine kinase
VFKVSARTVLELGAELISSDIIAFYELIKNAFDAGSETGAEIHFKVVLRRNSYLRLRSRVHDSLAAVHSGAHQEGSALEKIRAAILEQLDPSAGEDASDSFMGDLKDVPLAGLQAALDSAYRRWNTVTVADTGSGMSLAELEQNYLVIGTPSRKKAIDVAVQAGVSKTPFLGEKGIGRLSAMRLGDRLRVETARAQDPRFNILDIDWRRFDDIDAMIEDIELEPGPGGAKPTSAWSGTRLIIGDLKEDWTDARVKQFAEYDFARLTDPFTDVKSRPRVALFWNGNRVAIPFMDRALLEHSNASFRGTYAIEEGEPILRCTLEASNLGFTHPRETDQVTLAALDLRSVVVGTANEVPDTALVSVGPFEFEGFWYNRRLLGSIDTIGDQRTVRELQKKWSGILLFRDRFRVFPYGDDEDDWLGLDRKALGRPGYALNKAQFVGRVTISRTANPELIDQTNREGLRENSEQQVFVGLLQHVIQALLLDFIREVERRYKGQSVELTDVKAEVAGLERRANSALARIRKVVPKKDAEVVDEIQEAFLEFQDLAERAQEKIREIEEDSRQLVHMAGVGLMVEVVAHELARSSEHALSALETIRTSDLSSVVRARLETLKAEMKSVNKRLRVLDPLSVSGRQRSELFDLKELLDDLREGHDAQFKRHRIQFNVTAPSGAIRIRAVKGMVVQILENLISNSVYWIQLKAARESRYVPIITVRLEKDPVTVYFADNGPGIAPENRERIFRPFWSLKEKTKRRGLGLYIARENATYLGAQLTLSDKADPTTERLHEFVLEFPGGASSR